MQMALREEYVDVRERRHVDMFANLFGTAHIKQFLTYTS